MQLPSNMLHEVFSEIDIYGKDAGLEIFYSTMVGLSGEMSEGWVTGIAVDASISMYDAFGRGIKGEVPESIKEKYRQKGWIETRTHDGREVHYWKKAAYEDVIKRGYVSLTENIVEAEARRFSAYLAEHLDEEGGTDIIYWACGKYGKNIEEFGELHSDACRTMIFNGPQKYAFGQATHLLPAITYFERKYRSAKRGFFVFITDGYIDDLSGLKDFTIRAARQIAGGRRNLFKAVLIGIGEKVDEFQMAELDDLDTGTDIDIWDHKIAVEMKDIMEIFAELVDENTIIGPMGAVYDDQGKPVVKYNDGVPAKGRFKLPAGCEFFTFEVGEKKIKQSIKNHKLK